MNTQNPVKAIRLKCLECSNNNIAEVTNCPVTSCALYPFRFGKNQYRKTRVYSEEEKKIRAEHLKAINPKTRKHSPDTTI